MTAFFILAINYYAYFGNDKIMISDFFQLTEPKYEYKDIEAIKSVDKLIAPNGNVVIDKHYIIEFSDSYKWSSRKGGHSNYEKDKNCIMKHLDNLIIQVNPPYSLNLCLK